MSQQTDPPPKKIFSQTVNQWIIYDAYEQHEIAKEAQEEKERKKSRASYEQENKSKESQISAKNRIEDNEDSYNIELSKKFVKAAKILERMVNQVIYDQVIKGSFTYRILSFINLSYHYNSMAKESFSCPRFQVLSRSFR